MFNFHHIRGIVSSGGTVEYNGISICDLREVIDFDYCSDKPYQVNNRYSKKDNIFKNLSVAVNYFMKECETNKR